MAVRRPHPADDQDDAEILEQQRDADRQVLDRVEETGLRPRDGEHAEPSDQAEVAAQQVPLPAQRPRRGYGQHKCGDADSSGDSGFGGPAGFNQRSGKRAGGCEGDGRQQGQHRDRRPRSVAGSQDPLGLDVISKTCVH